MNKLLLITLLLLAACGGDRRDHYSAGTIVRVYTDSSNGESRYFVDFVPDKFPTDTAAIEIDSAVFAVANKGDRVDYQKFNR